MKFFSFPSRLGQELLSLYIQHSERLLPSVLLVAWVLGSSVLKQTVNTEHMILSFNIEFSNSWNHVWYGMTGTSVSLWNFCVRKQVVHEKLKEWAKVGVGVLACFHGLTGASPEAILHSSPWVSVLLGSMYFKNVNSSLGRTTPLHC